MCLSYKGTGGSRSADGAPEITISKRFQSQAIRSLLRQSRLTSTCGRPLGCWQLAPRAAWPVRRLSTSDQTPGGGGTGAGENPLKAHARCSSRPKAILCPARWLSNGPSTWTHIIGCRQQHCHPFQSSIHLLLCRLPCTMLHGHRNMPTDSGANW